MFWHEPRAIDLKGRAIRLTDIQLRTTRFLSLVTILWVVLAIVALKYVSSQNQRFLWICVCLIPVLMQVYYTSIEVDF